jgi:site-specific DNA-methyltransferase (adenine-specific)
MYLFARCGARFGSLAGSSGAARVCAFDLLIGVWQGRGMELVLSTAFGHLHQGDCADLFASIPSGTVDCVFADPPFNLAKNYGAGIDDALPAADYLAWCTGWIESACRVVSPGGAVWIYNLPKWNIELGHMLNDRGMTFRHWVAVDLKMSLPIAGRLYPSHYSLLYFTKGKPRVFLRPRTPIQVCRHCGGDVKDYGGHRKKIHPDGVNVSDVWTDITPVRHAKTKHRAANALSEKLVERVLTVSTQPGDLVCDPFGGSGTTYAVAERMHRHWIGSEIGDCAPIVARLTGGSRADVMPNLGDAGRGRVAG